MVRMRSPVRIWIAAPESAVLFMSMALLVLNKGLILRRERGGVWGEAPFLWRRSVASFGRYRQISSLQLRIWIAAPESAMLFMSMALLVLNKDLILRRERGGVWGEAPFLWRRSAASFGRYRQISSLQLRIWIAAPEESRQTAVCRDSGFFGLLTFKILATTESAWKQKETAKEGSRHEFYLLPFQEGRKAILWKRFSYFIKLRAPKSYRCHFDIMSERLPT